MALNSPGDFIFNEAALTQLLQGPNGPVALDLAFRGQRGENQAKINASGRPGPNVRTGRLRSSISFRVESDARGLYVDVGSGVPYAYPLETGMGRFGVKYPFLVPAIPAMTT